MILEIQNFTFEITKVRLVIVGEGGGALSHSAHGHVKRYSLFAGRFGRHLLRHKTLTSFDSATLFLLKDVSSERLIQVYHDVRLYTAEHSVKLRPTATPNAISQGMDAKATGHAHNRNLKRDLNELWMRQVCTSRQAGVPTPPRDSKWTHTMPEPGAAASAPFSFCVLRYCILFNKHVPVLQFLKKGKRGPRGNVHQRGAASPGSASVLRVPGCDPLLPHFRSHLIQIYYLAGKRAKQKTHTQRKFEYCVPFW